MTWAVSSCIVLHSCSSASSLHQLQQFLLCQSMGKPVFHFRLCLLCRPLEHMLLCDPVAPNPQHCVQLYSLCTFRRRLCIYVCTLRQLSLSSYVFQFAFSHQMYNTCVHVRKVEVWYVWSTSWMCEFMSKLLANEFVDVCTTTDVWQKKISTLG